LHIKLENAYSRPSNNGYRQESNIDYQMTTITFSDPAGTLVA